MLTQTSQHSNRQWLTDLVWLSLFFGIFYALFIGSHALFTPDEGRYSEVAREMIVTGDFITPRLNGVVFLDKPILYYWLQASAIALFGLQEWALRFWPALVGVLGCLMTYVAGRLLFNRRTGIISGVILATSPLFYGAAHYANLDLEVATFISISLLSFIVAMQTSSSKQRNGFLINSYVFAGLAALTKGLIGLAFPGMIIGMWILLLGRWDTLKKMRLLSGLLIFAVITLPWYFLVQKANPEFFQFFFVKQQVSRFLTTDHFNNRTPAWFYLPIVLAGLFPWCVFALQALYRTTKTILTDRKNYAVELYLLLWLILIFVFFSIPKSKTIGYILPVFPALAILIGNYLNACWDKTRDLGLRIGSISFVVFSIGIAVVCAILPYTQAVNSAMAPYLFANVCLFLTAGIIYSFLLIKKSSFSRLFFLIVVTAVLFLLNVSLSSQIINEKTIKPLATQLKPALKTDDEIVAFYRYFQDLPIYLERRITIVADWEAKDIPLNDNWVRELWYGMPFQDTKEWLIGEETFWQRWNGSKRLFVFTDLNHYKVLERKSKKIYKIATYGNAVLVSNSRVD